MITVHEYSSIRTYVLILRKLNSKKKFNGKLISIKTDQGLEATLSARTAPCRPTMQGRCSEV